MPEVVISDTSALILFHNIQSLHLLKQVYGTLLTTPEVVAEYGESLPEWFKIKEAEDKKYQRFLETQIDSGEASALALAAGYKEVLLILDDLKARKLARQLNLKVTGTLGVIQKAKDLGVIPKVRPYINRLLETNFRISDIIISELLKMNNE